MEQSISAKIKIVIKLSYLCHGTVIAYRFNNHVEISSTTALLNPNLESIMELLEMRDESLIDEWADYEDYDYVDDATEL